MTVIVDIYILLCLTHIHEEDQQDADFFLINLFQLNYTPHVSNRQVRHQEVISVHTAYSIFHAYM